MTENVCVIFCAPKSVYPEQPNDISKCELIDCPSCKEPMWFSEKKKMMKKLSESLGKEVIFECYICFTNRVTENPQLMEDHKMIKI